MPIGKWGTRNLFPGLRIGGGPNDTISQVAAKHASLFTETNKTNWLMQPGDPFFHGITLRMPWRQVYTNHAVRPTDPTDYTDAGYSWTRATSYLDSTLVQSGGAKVMVEVFDRYNQGQPQFVINSPYDCYFDSNNGLILSLIHI